jgi:hypothetical protein
MTLLRNRAKALQLDYLLTNADHNAINFWKKAPRRLDHPPACARGCAALSARLCSPLSAAALLGSVR